MCWNPYHALKIVCSTSLSLSLSQSKVADTLEGLSRKKYRESEQKDFSEPIDENEQADNYD